MQILIVKNKDEKSILYDKLSKTNLFLEINADQDVKSEILKANLEQSKTIFMLDWSQKNKDDLNQLELSYLPDDLKLFIYFGDIKPSPKPTPKPGDNTSFKWIPLIVTPQPYPNLDYMKIVKSLNLPWNSIYTEYFWYSISTGEPLVLFEGNNYSLSNEDVAMFVLGTRYFAKARYIYKLTQENQKNIGDLGKTVTYLLHGLSKSLPFSNPQEFLNQFNIYSKFDLEVIKKYISDDSGNLRLMFNNIVQLSEKISEFLKALNFDYWLKAIACRLFIETHQDLFKNTYSEDDYKNYYSLFSGLEHSIDFVLSTLYEFSQKSIFDQYFENVLKLQKTI